MRLRDCFPQRIIPYASGQSDSDFEAVEDLSEDLAKWANNLSET